MQRLSSRIYHNTLWLLSYVERECADKAIDILMEGDFDWSVFHDISPYYGYSYFENPIPIYYLTWCQIIMHRFDQEYDPDISDRGCMLMGAYWNMRFKVDMFEEELDFRPYEALVDVLPDDYLLNAPCPSAACYAVDAIEEDGSDRREYYFPEEERLPPVQPGNEDLKWLFHTAACAQCSMQLDACLTLQELLERFSQSDFPAERLHDQLEQIAIAAIYGGWFCMDPEWRWDKDQEIQILELEFFIDKIEDDSQIQFLPCGTLLPTTEGVKVIFDDCEHHRIKASFLIRGYCVFEDNEAVFVNKDDQGRYCPAMLLEEYSFEQVSAGSFDVTCWIDNPYSRYSQVEREGMIYRQTNIK